MHGGVRNGPKEESFKKSSKPHEQKGTRYMTFIRRFRRPVAAALAAAMFTVSVPVIPVQAAMIGTDQVIRESEGSARDKVNAFLAREDVERQLQALGVDPAEAVKRVAALSDHEINIIAGKIDEMPAGQGAVGAIIGAIVLVFILLVITDLLGLTHVFGFTRKGALNPN